MIKEDGMQKRGVKTENHTLTYESKEGHRYGLKI
jgi:hypothetical protein